MVVRKFSILLVSNCYKCLYNCPSWLARYSTVFITIPYIEFVFIDCVECRNCLLQTFSVSTLTLLARLTPLQCTFWGWNFREYSIACSHSLTFFTMSFLFHFSLTSFSKFGCNPGDFIFITFSFFGKTIHTHTHLHKYIKQ